MEEYKNCYDRNVVIPSREKTICNIPVFIVDSHNLVLPFWYSYIKTPAILLHVDDHSDMSAGVRTFANAKQEYPYAKIETLEDYARECLGIESFISVAIADEKIGAVYHIIPRRNKIHAYGRVREDEFIGTPRTCIDRSGRIKWQDDRFLPLFKEISETQLVEDISKVHHHPIILDIDLDAFHLAQVDPINQPYLDRVMQVKRIMEKIPKPTVITVTRSQTPTTYVNPAIVDRIERDCLNMLGELYG